VYEDDGVTENFHVNSANSVTNLAFTDSALRMVIDHPIGTYSGSPSERRYVVRIHGLTSPVGMRVNQGATLPAFTSETAAILNGSGEVWDPARKILSVVTPSIKVVTGGGTAATIAPSGSAFPAPSGGTVYGAEDAQLSGVALGSSHAGYTGDGYVDFINATNDFVEWTINVAAAGTHKLKFRYANGGAANRPLAISVNGAVVNGSLAFAPTNNWTTWANASLDATLPAGSAVKIRATAIGSSGGNLDCLTVQ
jgi:alpha-D-xyloside xylohydrolase